MASHIIYKEILDSRDENESTNVIPSLTKFLIKDDDVYVNDECTKMFLYVDSLSFLHIFLSFYYSNSLFVHSLTKRLQQIFFYGFQNPVYSPTYGFISKN